VSGHVLDNSGLLQETLEPFDGSFNVAPAESDDDGLESRQRGTWDGGIGGVQHSFENRQGFRLAIGTEVNVD
jgi:hypothetical protein